MRASKRKLVVGLTTRHGTPEWVRENTQHYINALDSFGVDWVLLAPDAPAIMPDGAVYQPDENGRLSLAVLAQMGGLILTGGGDVDPSYYGEQLAGANPKVIDLSTVGQFFGGMQTLIGGHR